jgi:hypothetical protein
MTRRSVNRGGVDRRRPRDSMLLLGTIRACGDVARQHQQIRIRNLSATGLMADTQLDYDLGCCVEVELRGIGTVMGQISWIRGKRMGIVFDRTVDPLLARKPLIRGQSPSAGPPLSTSHAARLPIGDGHVRRPGLRVR